MNFCHQKHERVSRNAYLKDSVRTLIVWNGYTKNGDAGQQYLSIVYVNGIRKQWLFYPDYIIKTKDNNVWIIETKGGMEADHSKNIDCQAENKFNAFKSYAERYKLHWGFVRDIDEELYINNTVYTEDMHGENWVPLKNILKI